jgi:phage N-6-adenine-methyltransferase
MPEQKPGRSRQDYGTPPELIQAVKERLHIKDFGIDLAAGMDNAQATVWFNEEQDSLAQNWAKDLGKDWGWLNPPFSNIEPWVMKASQESNNGAHIVMLVPASVGANWWRHWVEPWAYQSFLNGRLTFVGETTPYPKDCALLLYTPWGFTGHEVWRWKK